MSTGKRTRRDFVCNTAVALGSVLLSPAATGQARQKGKEQQEEVPPAEDLMREHGVLRRVLLIYEEVLHRMAANQFADPQPLAQAAGIVRRFIEDYHEKQEEDFLFPRFEKVGKLTELVTVLRNQHQIGRSLTRQIVEPASEGAFRDQKNQQQAAAAMRGFIRLYRPHAAREDTVLFPALHDVYTPSEYRELGEHFEDREHKQFGQNGFESVVGQVAEIEKRLGIFALAEFSRPH